MKPLKTVFPAIIILLTIALTSCNKESKFVEQTVNDKYAISVPENMTYLPGMSDEASFQYGDEAQEFYVLIIDESREEFYAVFDEYFLEELYERNLKGYTDMVIDNMSETSDIFNVGAYKELTINGMDAYQTDFYGVFNELDIYYHFTTVESDNSFYQIMSWTLKPNMEKHKPDMGKIASSFKEL